MDINEKWADDLIVRSIESDKTNWDDDSCRTEVYAARVFVTFFNHDYTVRLYRSDVLENGWHTVLMDGPSILFDSLNSLLEDKYWDKLVEIYKKHEDNLNVMPA